MEELRLTREGAISNLNSMKKYIGIPLAFIALAVPAGLAFADNGSEGSAHSSGSSSFQAVSGSDSNGTNIEIRHSDSQENVGHGDMGSTSTSSVREHSNESTSTPWMNGLKLGLFKHFGTTTPPGIERRHATSTDKESTSTENHSENKGNIQSTFSSFWKWIMGLPATTTVGDIRSQAESSTTATTTTKVSEPVGFFARLFGFFHFGGNKD